MWQHSKTLTKTPIYNKVEIKRKLAFQTWCLDRIEAVLYALADYVDKTTRQQD